MTALAREERKLPQISICSSSLSTTEDELLSHADTANQSIINIVSRSKGWWSNFLLSHLLLGRKWKHNWGKILQMPQISAFHFQQLKATSAHPSNRTLPVNLLLAWDIWKVSDTGDRILHPATTQTKRLQCSARVPSPPASLLPHVPDSPDTAHWVIRMRCLSTNYSISSNAAAENRCLHLPCSSPHPCLPK